MLKATFDQAGVDIKEALNALIAELEASTSANNIGANIGSVTTKTVQAILTNFEGAIANRYTKLEADTLLSAGTNNLVADLDVNLTTGIITVTKKDGTVEKFDTALEKVPAKFEIVESGTSLFLKITNVDGTSTQTNITELMNIYDFNNTNDIAFDVSGTGNEKVVTASIRPNSIGLDKLSLSVMTTLEGYMTSARDSANAAKISETNARDSANTATKAAEKASIAEELANTAINKATEAESYAHGGTGTRDGEDTDNAKYYSQIAKEIAGGEFVTTAEMEAYAQKKGTAPTFESTQLTGEVIETELPLAMESILKVSGNSEQETSDVMPSPDYPSEIRSVKSKSDNLLPNTATTTTVNGITFTVNKDKSITINGTATAKATIILATGMKEVLDVGSCMLSLGRPGQSGVSLGAKTEDSEGTAKYLFTGSETKWDLDKVYYLNRSYIDIESGTTLNNFVVKPMLNKGDKALPYQPYGYVPVEVKVEGKNLFDKNNAPLIRGYTSGSTMTIVADTSVRMSYIKCKPNTTYTAQKISGYLFTLSYSDVEPAIGTRFIERKIANTGTTVSITTNDKAKYLIIEYYKNDAELQPILDSIQIEEGSTATAYEPYKAKTLSLPLGDIELRSTPDGARDTFERVDGVWNYRGNIYSEIFDGSSDENIEKNPYGTNSYRIPVANRYLTSTEKVLTITNRFTSKNYNDRTLNTPNILYTEQQEETYSFVTVRNTNFTTLDEFKTWLSSNPTQVDYALATPTYTPITDTALIQALDKLENLILHKGYNRITVTSVNGVKAYLDLSIPSTASVTEVVETEASLDMPVVVVAGEGDVKPKVANQLTVNPSTGEVKIKGSKIAIFDAGEEDLEAGVSELETGKIYFVYE